MAIGCMTAPKFSGVSKKDLNLVSTHIMPSDKLEPLNLKNVQQPGIQQTTVQQSVGGSQN